jgi:hypothetical protein
VTSPLSLLLEGVAQALNAAGVGVWSPNAAVAGAWPIALEATLPNADTSIVITPYDLSADPKLSDRVTGLNIKVRGDRSPATSRDKAHEVYGVLQGLRGALPNGQRVAQIFWQSEVQIGPDTNGRWERSINYYAQWNVAFSGAE